LELSTAEGRGLVGRVIVGEKLDRLRVNRLHLTVLALCTLGLAVDIGEVALSNAFSAIFLAPPYNASRAEVSWLLAAIFAGGAIGAPAFGQLADRAGRRFALQVALAIVVVGSAAAAASPDIRWMTGFRVLSGFALGAYPPLTAAYLSDVLPMKRRGALMMLCAALAFLGAPGFILLIRWLTPLAPFGAEGWRWALMFGAALSAAAALLFFLVPESPRWSAALGRTAKAARGLRRFEAAGEHLPLVEVDPARRTAERQGVSRETASPGRAYPRYAQRSTLLAALYALGPWASIGFPLLSASMMVQKGFRVSDSLIFAGLSMFGPTIGIGAAASFVDQIERRSALILCAGAMAALALFFAAATDFGPLTLLGLAFNLASALYSAILALYGAELFPTAFRAFGTSIAWALGRIVSGIVPIVLLFLLGAFGALPVCGVIAAAMLVSLLIVLRVGPPGLAGRPIE
jgi:MFS transporter, putative metabolite:H+ symporter